jgi:hypothetical protein
LEPQGEADMGKKQSSKELLAKSQFDQILENIEEMSEIYFNEYEKLNHHYIDEELQKDILLHIEHIDKDVFNSLERFSS